VRYVSHCASTPQGPKGVTTLRISGRVRGGSFVDPATPAASPNVKGAQENTSVSAKSWEPLCYTPFSQVVSDRRRGRERSLGVQLNVLFRHLDSAARVAPPPALTSHCMRAFTCIHASPSTPMTHLAACPVQAASSWTSCRASSTRRACRRWRACSGSLPEPATRPRGGPQPGERSPE
jgi:hypothetical protein